MSQGVEWAVHVLLTFAWLDDGEPVSTAQRAASYDLPPAYLNKQLQALARAGLLESLPGARGGFRLARVPEKITLMDIVAAIEGPDEAFRCTEIRQRGNGRGHATQRLRGAVRSEHIHAPRGDGVASCARRRDRRRRQGGG